MLCEQEARCVAAPRAEVEVRIVSAQRLSFTERGAGPPLLLVHGLMVTGEMFAPVVASFATSHRVIVPDLRGHGCGTGLGRDGAAWLADLIASQNRALMVAAWEETIAFDSQRRLAEIACPTLMVAGSADRAEPLHHAHVLHTGIPHAELVVIAGAGHSTRPTELVRLTEAFLGASSASTAAAALVPGVRPARSHLWRVASVSRTVIRGRECGAHGWR
jgi:pimeloyl-ACP methyl ester carboxylesterase